MRLRILFYSAGLLLTLVSAPAGLAAFTATSPSYTIDGSTLTGLFGNGLNQLALVTNGTAALAITAAGNVGIGTAAPAAALDVNGGVRVGSASVVTATCAAATEGIMRYNYASHALELCNATSWLQLPLITAGATAPVTASGPPVNANIYAYTATANYTLAYGALSNLNNGTWLPNGTTAYRNASCLSLYNGTSAAGQIITIDLGSVKTINNVYATINGLQGDMNLGIAFSLDNSSFPNSTSLSLNSNQNYVYFTSGVVSPSVTARYLRLTNGGYYNDQNIETLCQFAVGP